MSAPKHILVPVDFSAAARAAADHAIAMARACGAEIKLLTVVEPPPPLAAEVTLVLPVDGQTFAEFTEERALEELVEFHRGLDCDGVKVALTAVTGHPRTCILEVAEAGKHDLIVMGTHGRTGLSRLVLGSIAEYVVRHAECPVTTVRK